LFRLWVVASGAWVALVLTFAASAIWDPILPQAVWRLENTTLPAERLPDYGFPPWVRYWTQVEFPSNTVVYANPEISQEELNRWAPGFAAQIANQRADDRATVRRQAALAISKIGLGPPAAVFVFGCLLVWIVAGFTNSDRRG
jgi:hypothetical protein